MKSIMVWLVFSMMSVSMYAQQSGCSCVVVLDKLIQKVEAEYPGFSVKTKERVSYDELKQKLGGDAGKVDSAGCGQVLRKYTDFFKDPHLWVGLNGSPFPSGNGGLAETIEVDVVDFKIQLRARGIHWKGYGQQKAIKLGSKGRQQ
ncbi:hypothetical protein [Paraflavitalea speifideaquila]|uniref:hypothetical protein n=1 Tax=Paraflavitalea speifideaquila TaxID=3076558 RepID=UPI0028F10420|nr:hypothetical protein [Paraflavitalea speifideiaquila]